MDRQTPSRDYGILAKMFLVSALVCWGVSLFGPFKWKVYSWEGMTYFVAVEVLFYLGLRLAGFFVVKREISSKTFRLTKSQVSLLTTVSLAAVLCCLYLSVAFFAYYGDAYTFGEAQYEFAEEGRGVLEKVLTCVLQLGMASYLILSSSETPIGKGRRAIVIAGFWTTAVYYIVSGSRFTSAVSLIVFLVANRNSVMGFVGRVGARSGRKGIAVKVGLAAAVVIVIVAVGIVTSTRMGDKDPMSHYEFALGDSPVRELYVPLASSDLPFKEGLFSLCDYVGESPYVFSYYYSHYLPDKIYFAQNTLRAVGQFLRPLGIDTIMSQSDIYGEIGGGTGKYSGIGFAAIVDFGVYGALAFAFLLGFLLGKVERNRRSSLFCRAFYPCAVCECLFAHIYFITVGRLDYVFFGILILLALLWLFGGGKTLGETDGLGAVTRHG